ncbi:LLM class flavin-dependent oxidoreductase [Klugiella xanthotipulae]|uniref:Alkanesulfonate monooxygenase SsuD/methylene tetrahydromethanopterin reductase-like flavin-dependent oxidoreductase (Luciferase family) n=1 Tax=Klugiella xanthotipulae TaxID=244735 RepID=A0A543HZD8_9MICO|nr:LLM class flavin-dependent oxidoreductase [Klugiella xanthotipulae]TQM63605.1 alkanesulfonate monooxygenase SsuD/methylene tetrahydromethanopterin reductase-like flavin-dependent oxidoreductase (luciferase family) [Klugiella xanthotipulae]
MSESTRPPFVIGVELDGTGAHPAAWRDAAISPRESLSPRYLARVAAEADRAGFSFLTLEDAPVTPETAAPDAPAGSQLSPRPGVTARLDALQRAAYVAPLTGSIGLVPFADAVYVEPFHLAAQLASLDIASAGRAGWVVLAEEFPGAAEAVSWLPAAGDDLPREATDTAAVSRLIWDSWQDDAVIRSVETGHYIDPERLHYVRYRGERFSVTGPGITPRPTQGHPVVFGRADRVAARQLEVAFVSAAHPTIVAERALELTGQVPRVVAELEVVLDARGERAAARLARLDAHTPAHTPDHTGGVSARGRFVGTAAGLVEHLTEYADVVHGVRLLPAVTDVDLPEIARAVLPELRRRGLFRSPVAGDTLRDTLGLDRPSNTFEAARAAEPASHPEREAAIR